MVDARAEAHKPSNVVVLMGASNVARGFSTAVETARICFGEPVRILAAHGHGRSYGIDSSVLGRRLPGIVHCGLWDALASTTDTSALALLTDIGNDLFYNVPVDVIIEWIEACITKLDQTAARITIALPPVCNVDRLASSQYWIFRAVMFPRCQLDLPQIVRLTVQLDERLRELAQKHSVRLVEPLPEWYGWDPIHIKLNRWSLAWYAMLARPEDQDRRLLPARGSLRRWAYLRSRIPHERYLLGRRQARNQPSAFLPDGTTVSLY